MTEPEKSDAKPDLKPGGPGPKTYYDGIVAPSFFHEESARAFRAMEMRSDDVVMASPVKAGTTWVHRILYLMLHGLDDDGNTVDSGSMLAKGQVYPDAIPLKAPTEPRPTEGPEAFRRNAFGDRGFEDMLAHAAPRLFPTHATARHLPAQLCAPDGTGRLVVVLRNLKDVLASLHFFYGEAKDGWLGNEHGAGSFNRYLADPCPNAYGSTFDWVAELDALVTVLKPSSRVLVLYYEQLKLDLPAQIDRIDDFLGAKMTSAKRSALINAVGFDAMVASKETKSVLLRKGAIGDWRNHLDEEKWREFDAVFEERLGECALAQPLREHQRWEG